MSCFSPSEVTFDSVFSLKFEEGPLLAVNEFGLKQGAESSNLLCVVCANGA
jgi:hypothetical protein